MADELDDWPRGGWAFGTVNGTNVLAPYRTRSDATEIEVDGEWFKLCSHPVKMIISFIIDDSYPQGPKRQVEFIPD